MAFINNMFRTILGVFEITTPTGVWEKIIMSFRSGIANYGWAIIIFTLVLKIIMLPVDFFNKKITEKNSRVQALIQPEIAKIQKQYGNNKQMVNQKTMEIYKKHNYNVTGSCFFMLLNMGLTLFIFITLLQGLNVMAAYKVGEQYQEMEKVYSQYVVETQYDVYLDKYEEYYQDILEGYISEGDFEEITAEEKAAAAVIAKEQAEDFVNSTEEEMLVVIHQAVSKSYNEVKESWLWISNVWKPDTPWTRSSTSFDEFVKMAGITYKTELAEGEESFAVRLETNKDADEQTYNLVMRAVESQDRENGYLIIPLLAVVTTALSLLAGQGKLKRKKKKEEEKPATPTPATGGIFMVVLIGGLMGYITLTFNSVFALYVTVGSLFGLATTPLVNWGIKKMNKWQEDRKDKKTVKESYKR